MAFFLCLALLLGALLPLQPSWADALGEYLLRQVIEHPERPPSDGTLLLLTRDLGWYEQNMKRLSPELQDRVQQLRIQLVGETTRQAAQSLKEPKDIFLASGSCRPGRDIDLLYLGSAPATARQTIDQTIRRKSAEILSASRNDPFLVAARKAGLSLPEALDSHALEVVTSNLPNFGYDQVNAALRKARAARLAGDPQAAEILKRELLQALETNLEAQFESAAKDMYRGAAGQRFFVLDYLGDPGKVRGIVRRPDGSWELVASGLDLIPARMLERVLAIMPTSRRARFAKVASDYAMFFKHEGGGIGGTAKYVQRIWEDVDVDLLLLDLSIDEQTALIAARLAAYSPADASAILGLMELTEQEVRQGVENALQQAVESQLVADMKRLLEELQRLDGVERLDDLEALFRRQLVRFDMNDLANGLAAIQELPGDRAARMIDRLAEALGDQPLAPSLITYLRQQLQLLADSGNQISRRVLRVLRDLGEISEEQYWDALRRYRYGVDLPQEIADKVARGRRELSLLASVEMFDLEGGEGALERLLGDWRVQRRNALIRKTSKEVAQTVDELKRLPLEELKRIGWLEVEIELPLGVRARLGLLSDRWAELAETMVRRLGRQAVSVKTWQRNLRRYLLSLSPTQLGEEGDLDPSDVLIAMATALVETHAILNRQPPLTIEEENRRLAEAWITALPIVGDLAQGIGSLATQVGSGEFHGRQLLESGLYVFIGVMAWVPGGQIPGLIASLMVAGAPLAEGVYDARQAHNLIQAWIESGDWKPGPDGRLQLAGLFDRDHRFHRLDYQGLLTLEGRVPFESERADGLFSVATIRDSLLDYAEKYLFPRQPDIVNLRRALQTVLTQVPPSAWETRYDVRERRGSGGRRKVLFDEKRVAADGGKGAVLLFRRYQELRIAVLYQTIAKLKEWAEKERRIAQDYEGEIARIRDELRRLQQGLKSEAPLRQADRSAEAYSRIVVNQLEQESLGLSRYRIYEHYLQVYRRVAEATRRILRRLEEIPDGYRPLKWYLTGLPELDEPRLQRLLAMIEQGRRGVKEKVSKLLDRLGWAGPYDPADPCQREAFQYLAALRDRIAFKETMADYFEQLAQSESAWKALQETALARYREVREQLGKIPWETNSDNIQRALAEAAVAVATYLPYALTADEKKRYREMADDFSRGVKRGKHDYEYAAFVTGEAGKGLERCLLQGLKIGIDLVPLVPEQGGTVQAKARLVAGRPPAEKAWKWELTGLLSSSERYGESIPIQANGPGEVTLKLMKGVNIRTWSELAVAHRRLVPRPPSPPPGGDGGDSGRTGATSPGDGPGSAGRASETEVPGGDGARPEIVPAVAERPPAPAFSITVPGNWEGGLSEDGRRFYFERQAVKGGPTGALCPYPARVTAFISGAIDPSFAPANEQEILASLNKTADDLRQGKRIHAVGDLAIKPFRIGTFQGHILEAGLGYSPGYTDGGYVDSGSSMRGHAWLLGEGHVIRLEYVAYGQGCFTNAQRSYQMNMTTLAGREARAIVDRLSLVDGAGEVKKTPYRGRKGDGSDLPRVRLVPSQPGPYLQGQQIMLAAVPDDITPRDRPLGFQWEGKLDADPAELKEVDSVPLDTSQPGRHRVNLTLSTASGLVADAVYEFQVLRVEAELGPLPDRVVYGHQMELRVHVEGGKGSLRYHWHASPGLSFDEADDRSPARRVTFDRMGEVDLWVDVLLEQGDSAVQVAETPHRRVRVEAPVFSITFDPPSEQARVGQEVVAEIVAKPALADDLIDYRWLEPSTANRMELEQNGRRIRFQVPEELKLRLRALARVPFHGDEIGEIEATYSGIAYQVKAWMVQPPALPQVWDPEKKGLVTVPRDTRLTGERITLAARLEGGKPPPVVRWQWQVNGGTSLSNPISSSPTVSRSEPGTIVARVSARDGDGRLLGEGQVSITVVDPGGTSPATGAGTEPGSEVAARKEEAERLVAGIRGQLERGELAAAGEGVERLRRLDPAAAGKLAWKVARAASDRGWQAAHDRDLERALADLRLAVRLAPQESFIAERLRRTEEMARVWPQVVAKAQEFHRLIDQHRVWTAHRLMREIDRLQLEMPGRMANPLSRAVMDRFNAELADYSAFMEERRALHSRHFVDQNWQAMLENAQATQSRELSETDAARVRGWIEMARNNLRQQAEIERARCPRIAGYWGWVAGQRLVVAEDGTFEVFKDGRSIDDGKWECLDGKAGRYRLIHRLHGYVDSVTLSADGRQLTGVNNEGFDLAGNRIETGSAPETGGGPATGAREVVPPADEGESTAVLVVLSATYGGNCGAEEGNVTAHIAAQCNGRTACDYRPNYLVIGDPAYGCGKDYVVRYRCGGGDAVREVTLPPEAGLGNRVARLRCPSPEAPVTPTADESGDRPPTVASSSAADVPVAGGPHPVGVWEYTSGGFRDRLVLYPGGAAMSLLHDGPDVGRWTLEGDELVMRWSNGWSNRYRLDPGDGPFTGTDTDPQGNPHREGRLRRISRTPPLAYYQLDFESHHNNERPIKPFVVQGVPLGGSGDGPAPMVWLTRCLSPASSEICFPETFEWPVPAVAANQIWIASGLYWWGNALSGEPVLRITVEGQGKRQSFVMRVNAHTAEWNGGAIQPAEGVTVHTGVQPSVTYESRFFVARFPFDQMAVTRVRLELLNAAPYGGDTYGVVGIYGITLVRRHPGTTSEPGE